MENMETNQTIGAKKKKPSLGRRKIALDKKIEKKSSLQVTFTKRRHGLFKKAAELSLCCGVDIAFIVRSPAGKIFSFGSPSADAVIRRYQGESSTSGQIVEHTENEGSRDFEPTTSGQIVENRDDQFWWNKPIESMGKEELEQFAQKLEALQQSQPAIPAC